MQCYKKKCNLYSEKEKTNCKRHQKESDLSGCTEYCMNILILSRKALELTCGELLRWADCTYLWNDVEECEECDESAERRFNCCTSHFLQKARDAQ